MSSPLARKLDILLQEHENVPDYGNELADILRQLDALHQQTLELQHKLRSVRMRANGETALQLRQKAPALDLSVDQDCCRCGFASRAMNISPSTEPKMVWVIGSNDDKFLEQFNQDNQRLPMNMSDFTDMVAAHFRRSFGEALQGSGRILIEGKKATLFELVEWARNKRELPSRKKRGLLR